MRNREKYTSFYSSEEYDKFLKAFALKRGIPKSALIKQALAEYEQKYSNEAKEAREYVMV
jgi:hypothetical protein